MSENEKNVFEKGLGVAHCQLFTYKRIHKAVHPLKIHRDEFCVSHYL